MLGRALFIALPLAPIWLAGLMLIEIHWGGEQVEYIEAYWQKPGEAEGSLKGVAMVHVNGELRHSVNGYNRPWYEETYTYQARFDSPDGYIELVGCPTYQDGAEAMELIAEFPEDRMALDVKDRA